MAVNYVLSDREHADLVLNAEQVVDKKTTFTLTLKTESLKLGEIVANIVWLIPDSKTQKQVPTVSSAFSEGGERYKFVLCLIV